MIDPARAPCHDLGQALDRHEASTDDQKENRPGSPGGNLNTEHRRCRRVTSRSRRSPYCWPAAL